MKEFTIVMGIVNAMRDNRVSHGLLYHNRCENALAVQLFILELVKLMNLVSNCVFDRVFMFDCVGYFDLIRVYLLLKCVGVRVIF